jgi:hypothetical protein
MPDEPLLHVAIYWLDERQRQQAITALDDARRDSVKEFAGLAEGYLPRRTIAQLVEAGLTLDVIDKGTLGLEIDDAAAKDVVGSHRRAYDLLSDPDYEHLRPTLSKLEESSPAVEGDRGIYHLRLRGRISAAIREQLESLGAQSKNAGMSSRWHRRKPRPFLACRTSLILRNAHSRRHCLPTISLPLRPRARRAI